MSGSNSEREPLKSVRTHENLSKKGTHQTEKALTIMSTGNLDKPGSVKQECWAQWTLQKQLSNQEVPINHRPLDDQDPVLEQNSEEAPDDSIEFSGFTQDSSFQQRK